MKHEDVKLWMKVIPHSKTADGRTPGLDSSVVWRDACRIGQPYLYVSFKRYQHEYHECRLVLTKGLDNGDYFMSHDFEKWEEK